MGGFDSKNPGDLRMPMTADLYRATLREMVDPHHPLVRLTGQIPWAALEAQMAPLLELRIPRLLGH